MIICKVLGSVWATRKYSELGGYKLMHVEELESGEPRKFITIDTVGAGIGERALVLEGSAAYHFIKETFGSSAPVDAVIVGILDEDVSL